MMPIGLSKAPKVLPKTAKQLWIDTFNGVFDECKGTTKECDAKAARIAWDNVKRKYRKVKDTWVAKSETEEAYQDLLLTITKASLQPDGSVRWQAVASDTGKDKAGEHTTVELFQDWIDRVTYGQTVPYLPEPKMPFLGVSHYPALGGYGEAGVTRRMYIDGNTFKADGVFRSDSPVGQRLLEAVRTEMALIKKGEPVEKPIRISAGWWDIQHYHEDSDYLFTRQSLTDKCPICEKGQTTDKFYKAGQIDHLAGTRVPMNVRTSLELKSMAKKITRKEDAESIIGPDEAEEMERRARMVGKSESEEDELPTAMATKADVTRGGYMRDWRKKRKMTMADVAKALEISEARLKRLEDDDDEMDDNMMDMMSEVFKMSAQEKEDMLARFGKKKKPPMKGKAEIDDEPDLTERAMMKTVGGEGFPAGDFLVVEDPEKPSTWHLQVKRHGTPDHGLMGGAWAALHQGYRGNKYTGPMKQEAINKLKKLYGSEDMETPTEKMDYGEGEMRPFGGATSLKEAENFIQNEERMDKMYSYWDMLKAAYGNIQSDMMMEPADKLKAVSGLFREMSGKIDTLKAGLSDAFLIQESAAAYEDYEDDYEDDDPADDTITTERSEVITMSDQNHPVDLLKAAYDEALTNRSLSRVDREKAIQEALNTFALEAKGELNRTDPLPPAEQIAGALKEVLGPLTEQIGLLTAKMNLQAQGQPDNGGLQQVYVPQQKSMAPGQGQQPQPVGQSELPVSPVTGKPSALTAQIRRSVGLPG